MEHEFISWIRERLPAHPLLKLGVGDDAAVLHMAGTEECVVTVDMLMDHVDFELTQVDPRLVGRKALAANLSDLAAMAAQPLAGVIAVALPCERCSELAKALYEGILPLAEQYDLIIAGGDTNTWEGPLVISITLIGKVTGRGPLRRSGAKPGDRILVTGFFGGSILRRHIEFDPRVREAITLHANYELHAGIDSSDGLSLDLSHIMEESDCGAVIESDCVPIDGDARRLACRLNDGSTPLDHALGDGEDFELIMAVPPDDAKRIIADQPLDVQITDIGYFTEEPGLWIHDSRGSRRPLTPRGWQH